MIGALIEIAKEYDICLTGRGGGTSQNGQTINQSLVIDMLTSILKIEFVTSSRVERGAGLGLRLSVDALSKFGKVIPIAKPTA